VVPAEFANFFLASSGAAAALAGLLFVAISVAPENLVQRGAPAERQGVAASVFAALLNAFFISRTSSLAAGCAADSAGHGQRRSLRV
jgi:hypothetical protein